MNYFFVSYVKYKPQFGFGSATVSSKKDMFNHNDFIKAQLPDKVIILSITRMTENESTLFNDTGQS